MSGKYVNRYASHASRRAGSSSSSRPSSPKGLLFDIVRNVDLPQIDGHISGIWLAGHQAHLP